MVMLELIRVLDSHREPFDTPRLNARLPHGGSSLIVRFPCLSLVR
jgi:hypothetical protein